MLIKSLRIQLPNVVLMLVLAGLVCWGALPGYLAGGKWRWMAPPEVSVLAELRNLKRDGIAIPGWQTIAKQFPLIGEHKWLQQDLSNNQIKATLLLLPQARSQDQPQVEWTDLDGSQSWKTDSQRSLQIPNSPATAEFLRAWTSKQTYAVLRWYAWNNGGHPTPAQWFFADRAAQWQNRRAPWIAVSLILPIEPLDDIENSRRQIESIAQTVQSTLTAKILQPNA